MKKENEDKLKAAFPQIFVDLHDSTPMESCMSEGHGGIACGDGWYELICDLCEDIMALHPPANFKAAQVKEKFGGLRFYPSGSTRIDMTEPDGTRTSIKIGNEPDKISDLIDAAENRSFKICEDCGSDDNVTCKGRPRWVATMCGSCAEANEKKERQFAETAKLVKKWETAEKWPYNPYESESDSEGEGELYNPSES